MTYVYKYPLAIQQSQFVTVPLGAEFLTAQAQHEGICLWALVTPSQKEERRFIEVFGTGHTMPPASRDYIGTVQLEGGSLIFHVFERR